MIRGLCAVGIIHGLAIIFVLFLVPEVSKCPPHTTLQTWRPLPVPQSFQDLLTALTLHMSSETAQPWSNRTALQKKVRHRAR